MAIDRSRLVVSAASALLVGVLAHAEISEPQSTDASDSGIGWSVTRLDMEVTVLPADKRLSVRGDMHLRLDAVSESFGPTIYLNTALSSDKLPVMRFTHLEAGRASVEYDDELLADRVQQVHVRFNEKKPKGSAIVVSFIATSTGVASQILVDDSVALASWTTGWHPFTNPTNSDDIDFTAGILSAPGELALRLPAGWVGLVDGNLVNRRRTKSATIENWSTPRGIARSVVAGPYRIATNKVGDREVRIYMLPDENTIGPDRLSQLVANAMAAQEDKFGPFPFPFYAVVEFPTEAPAQTWSAASQQSFIVAKASNFDWNHGNLPLWAHEMAHGWWGNTVGTQGKGGKWCGESLAQFGALVSIEALEGRDALNEFLGFSRTGYSPHQSAAGYFAIVRQGQDLPISTMGQSAASHDIADSKGAWIYHMLRSIVGDDVFFGVLRHVIRDFAHKRISADELRARFIEAAPQHNLEQFFSQWLDRDGAPILDVDWQAGVLGDSVYMEIIQTQQGDPFSLTLEVEIELSSGDIVTEAVAVSDKVSRFSIKVPSRPRNVQIDPNYKLLIWRPEYGPRPGDSLASATNPVPDSVISAIIGSYQFRSNRRNVRVFAKDGEVFIQPADAPASRLIYNADGSFFVDQPGPPMITEFDLSQSPAVKLVSIEGDYEYIADRLPE